MEGTEPGMGEWIQSRRQCTDGYVLFASVEVVVADGRNDMRFRVVWMVLDQVEVCQNLSLVEHGGGKAPRLSEVHCDRDSVCVKTMIEDLQ